ncbi:hypothetical protein ACROYT_G008853, partial [Oculina patagonica]
KIVVVQTLVSKEQRKRNQVKVSLYCEIMSMSKLVSTEAEQEFVQVTKGNWIQSAVREYIPGPHHGGNLLMAEVKSGRPGVHVPVMFTGTGLSDEKTVFHLDRNDRYQADILRCDMGDQSYYYLCAEDEQVYLLKTVAQEPNDEKFMFQIKRVMTHDDKHDHLYENGYYWTIMSLSTGMFLASDKEGKAFMKKVGEKYPEDRQTWFHFMPSFAEAATTFSSNYEFCSIEFKTNFYRQTSEVEAC